jgi:hypothetical protein
MNRQNKLACDFIFISSGHDKVVGLSQVSCCILLENKENKLLLE